MPDPPWFTKLNQRKSIKALPTPEEYREKRREKWDIQQKARQNANRNAKRWKRRTEQYQTNIHGVFSGSYYQPPGQTILVRGNTKAQIRYEAVRGVQPIRWLKVPYEAPR